MKFVNVLPLAALTAAFVLPPEEVIADIEIEEHGHLQNNGWYEHVASAKDGIVSSFKKHYDEVAEVTSDAYEEAQAKFKVTKFFKTALDEAFDYAEEAVDGIPDDFQAWFDDDEAPDEPPHHGKPEHGKPGHGKPGHGKPGKHPHHGCKPNKTIYELISQSKYTTKLAKLISEYDDLVEALNTTSGNFTVFAPTDKAFAKIPDKAPKPSKEQLKAILEYHVVPGLYPAGRVLATHTAPTLLKSDSLGSEPEAQRISFKLSLRGLLVNYFSRVVAVNVFATNGVIHGVDSLILPPPSVITWIDLFPGEFSTLELGLGKTGLLEKLNTTDHAGGTFFAPSNFAFKKLGPKINAFLFSKYGVKYLKALLEYHVVPDNTLYSDAYYKAKDSESQLTALPKGRFHVDLPTLLADRFLSIDIARLGGFISFKINGFSSVAVQDTIAEDGVIHVVRSVLAGAGVDHWDGSELTVDDLKERLEPLIAKSDL